MSTEKKRNQDVRPSMSPGERKQRGRDVSVLESSAGHSVSVAARSKRAARSAGDVDIERQGDANKHSGTGTERSVQTETRSAETGRRANDVVAATAKSDQQKYARLDIRLSANGRSGEDDSATAQATADGARSEAYRGASVGKRQRLRSVIVQADDMTLQEMRDSQLPVYRMVRGMVGGKHVWALTPLDAEGAEADGADEETDPKVERVVGEDERRITSSRDRRPARATPDKIKTRAAGTEATRTDVEDVELASGKAACVTRARRKRETEAASSDTVSAATQSDDDAPRATRSQSHAVHAIPDTPSASVPRTPKRSPPSSSPPAPLPATKMPTATRKKAATAAIAAPATVARPGKSAFTGATAAGDKRGRKCVRFQADEPSPQEGHGRPIPKPPGTPLPSGAKRAPPSTARQGVPHTAQTPVSPQHRPPKVATRLVAASSPMSVPLSPPPPPPPYSAHSVMLTRSASLPVTQSPRSTHGLPKSPSPPAPSPPPLPPPAKRAATISIVPTPNSTATKPAPAVGINKLEPPPPPPPPRQTRATATAVLLSGSAPNVARGLCSTVPKAGDKPPPPSPGPKSVPPPPSTPGPRPAVANRLVALPSPPPPSSAPPAASFLPPSSPPPPYYGTVLARPQTRSVSQHMAQDTRGASQDEAGMEVDDNAAEGRGGGRGGGSDADGATGTTTASAGAAAREAQATAELLDRYKAAVMRAVPCVYDEYFKLGEDRVCAPFPASHVLMGTIVGGKGNTWWRAIPRISGGQIWKEIVATENVHCLQIATQTVTDKTGRTLAVKVAITADILH